MILPNPADAKSFDRYAYVNNNPINYNDPSGQYLVEGDWLDPNSGMYSTGYNQYGNTVLLSPRSSRIIYGVLTPIRVAWATLIDPQNKFAPYAAAMYLGIAETGKSILPGSMSFKPSNSIPKNLLGDVIQEPFADPSINAPTNPGLLRKNMIKAGNLKPLDMKNPNAHHGLPWKFKDWFAFRGLDVNDPEFGMWVEGREHAKWSWRYNMVWEEFISINRYTSPQKIIEFMWQMMSGGEFQSK